jgi:hypothetical protein
MGVLESILQCSYTPSAELTKLGGCRFHENASRNQLSKNQSALEGTFCSITAQAL